MEVPRSKEVGMSYGEDREFRSIRLAIFRECSIFAHLKPTFHFEMKKFVLVLAAAAFMVALPSCKKCSTCKYTYNDGTSTATFTYPEFCGKKKEVDTYESACKTAAALYTSGSCSCDKS